MAGAGRRDHVCVCSLNSGMDVFLLGLRGMGWACGGAESVGCWSQLLTASCAYFFPTEVSGIQLKA